MLRDALGFVLECMRLFAREQTGMFLASVAAAIVLGGLCWWGCTHYTKLWHLRFEATFTHHALCGFAAICTIAFVIAFAGLSQAKEVARRKVDAWHKGILKDKVFGDRTYRKAYAEVQRAGIEKFDPNKHFPPGDPKSLIPSNFPQTRLLVSKIYGDGSCVDFRNRYPFVSSIIWPSGQIPLEVVEKDMQDYFAKRRGGTYQLHRSIDLAAEQIEKSLEPNTPKVVSIARRYAVVLFLLVQFIPFALIGYAAYRDLKETT